MKVFTFFDRQGRKTLEALIANHLAAQYRLPPQAAKTLSQDAVVFGRLWAKRTREPGQILFHAVAIGEPPAKPLKDCRLVEVRLTLRHQSDLEFRRQHGLHALNRRIMLRIAREAIEQGAVLTNEDLADLLRLSIATVKRYKRQLALHGSPLRTRGDLADMGPASSHRDLIVKLFLQGFSESEIAARTSHCLKSVEAYIADFLRIALLQRDGYSHAHIARLTRLSKHKTQALLRLVQQLHSDHFYHHALQRVLDIYSLERAYKKGGLS